MKKISIYIFILLSLSSNIVLGQVGDKKQEEAGTKFLKFVVKGDYEKNWELFDKVNIPDVSKEQFIEGMGQLNKIFAPFDSFQLTMTGIQFIEDKQVVFYSFKAISSSKNVINEMLVDVLFFKSSSLVAGIKQKIKLKENTGSSSKAKETSIEKNITAVIENVTYNITGINIVHFENDEGLLAIQIEYKLPEGIPNQQEWGKKEGVKFAKFLVEKGYLEKAKAKAKEINRKLLESIGVSFFDEAKGGGFNVMLKPEEFK